MSRVTPLAAACLTIFLGACARDLPLTVAAPAADAAAQVVLPKAPPASHGAPCFKVSSVVIPDRALTEAEVYRIIGTQADEIAVRNMCGREGAAWISKVRSRLGRKP